jgi:small subunit ribosomal protein S20
MPNIKSAKKRVRVIEKKTLQNKMIRSQMNTVIKKFNSAVSGNNEPLATELLPQAMSLIDSAAVAGVIHKNNANNKKSRLSKTLHSLKSGKIVIKIDAKQAKQLEQKAAGAAKKAAELERIAARDALKAAAPKLDAKKDGKKDKEKAAKATKAAKVKKPPESKPETKKAAEPKVAAKKEKVEKPKAAKK